MSRARLVRHRYRILRLAKDPGPALRASLPGTLRTVPGVLECTVNGRRLAVRYRYPRTGFSLVLRCLYQGYGREILAPGYCLWYRVMAWCEENERSHLLRPPLAQSWIETVHLSFFDRRHAAVQDHRRHSWQKIRRQLPP